ncbi:transcription initiation factor TFIID subunit 5, partial [Drosophila navojoa]|uniref:transcription initiation factor TFIID subunit 5 n=1 Tax=Drosophila navojoa TaxID=7232 RepID=UPI0011BDFA6B
MAVAPSDFNELELIGSEQKPKYDPEPELCANPITEASYDMGMFASEWGINVANEVESTVDNVQSCDSLGGEPACLDVFSHDNTARKYDEVHENEMVTKNVETNESKDDDDDDNRASKTIINIGGCIYSDVEFTDDSDSENSSGSGNTDESNDESQSSDNSLGIFNEDDLLDELESMETAAYGSTSTRLGHSKAAQTIAPSIEQRKQSRTDAPRKINLTNISQLSKPMHIQRPESPINSNVSQPTEETPQTVSSSDKKRDFEKTTITYLTNLSKMAENKAQGGIGAASIISSPPSTKDSDTEELRWRRKAKQQKSGSKVAKDFYEQDNNIEDNMFEPDYEEDAFSSDLLHSNVLNDYEKLFHKIRKIVDRVPNRFKYEIYSLMYPALALAYLRMVSSGKYRKGKSFVESSMRYIDHSYVARVGKLMILQTPGDLPNKAKRLLSDEKIHFCMLEETYYVLLLHMERWSRSLQETFLRHFDLSPYDENEEPRQVNRIGSPILEKIYWATTDTVKENKESSPRPMKRRRFKKDKSSLAGNEYLPIGNRLYIPTPKRWDQERLKDDEERRVPLNRESLPSAYLYTAQESSETVICASFSSKTTMISIGTDSSLIHIFSLTSSKLVQLKSAECLKRLDTSISGIDDSMLDATKRKLRRTLYGHQGPIYGCSFSPNDRFLLSCSQDRTVRCWCLLSWNCVVIYPGHCGAIYSVVYAPLGYFFATSSDDRTARIWTQDSKKSVCILMGHLAEVIICQFHPNRHYLATGSADCTVRLWDVMKATQVRIFSAHRNSINALAFSICGRYLVSGGDDSYVILWDTDKEQMVRWLSHHTAAINSIEFGHDNKMFIVGGHDCKMSLWDFERLVREYDSEKLKAMNNPDTDINRPELTTKDFLIKSYASRGTPFYELRITRRNLLLGFCVQLKDNESKRSADSMYSEWLEFLDILKLKACFQQPNSQFESNHYQEMKVEEP